MKTAEQIRQHRDDMREALIAPCDCQGKHAKHCKSGGRMMCMAVDLMNWILDENPNYEEVIRRMRQC